MLGYEPDTVITLIIKFLIIQVHVAYKKSKFYTLTPTRKKFGKAIARGSKYTIAKECFKDPTTRKFALDCLGNILRKEMKVMMSDNTNSILRGSDIKCFTWDILLNELKQHSPNFFHLLGCLTKTKSTRPNEKATIGVCAAILLKHRYFKMSLVQKITSIILYSGHTSKQVSPVIPDSVTCSKHYHYFKVYTRLQKLNFCMSHSTVIRLVNQLGFNHDIEVKQWKESLEQNLTEVSESCY